MHRESKDRRPWYAAELRWWLALPCVAIVVLPFLLFGALASVGCNGICRVSAP